MLEADGGPTAESMEASFWSRNPIQNWWCRLDERKVLTTNLVLDLGTVIDARRQERTRVHTTRPSISYSFYCYGRVVWTDCSFICLPSPSLTVPISKPLLDCKGRWCRTGRLTSHHRFLSGFGVDDGWFFLFPFGLTVMIFIIKTYSTGPVSFFSYGARVEYRFYHEHDSEREKGTVSIRRILNAILLTKRMDTFLFLLMITPPWPPHISLYFCWGENDDRNGGGSPKSLLTTSPREREKGIQWAHR